MEYLPNGYTLSLCEGSFPLSTDSMCLAHFVRLPRKARVLDLGSGCGTLGLLLCCRDSHCAVTGLELSDAAHQAALENIRRNQLENRMSSICTDLRQPSSGLSDGSFHCCVSNPPYFSGGPASLTNPLARRDDCCTPEDLFRTASKALKFGGDFYLVHKPEKLAQLIVCGAAQGLEAKELVLVRHRDGSAPSMILMRFKKGGKPGLRLFERSLFDSRNLPTDYFREVYHIKGD
jgi:tRNA1(Val) A37 N6-methylase TrmN6